MGEVDRGQYMFRRTLCCNVYTESTRILFISVPSCAALRVARPPARPRRSRIGRAARGPRPMILPYWSVVVIAKLTAPADAASDFLSTILAAEDTLFCEKPNGINSGCPLGSAPKRQGCAVSSYILFCLPVEDCRSVPGGIFPTLIGCHPRWRCHAERVDRFDLVLDVVAWTQRRRVGCCASDTQLPQLTPSALVAYCTLCVDIFPSASACQP